MIIFKIRIFELSDVDQDIYEHIIQRKYEFLPCLKKVIRRNGKNPIFYVSRTTLCRQKIKTCMLKFLFAVEKNIWGNFKFTGKFFLKLYDNCIISKISIFGLWRPTRVVYWQEFRDNNYHFSESLFLILVLLLCTDKNGFGSIQIDFNRLKISPN